MRLGGNPGVGDPHPCHLPWVSPPTGSPESRCFLPGTWRGALAQADRQTATAGLPLPARQERTAGLLLPRHVPRLCPGGVPKEQGRSPACPSPRLEGAAGSLGLNPPKVQGFVGLPWPLGGQAGPGGAVGRQAVNCPRQRSAVGGRDGSGASGGDTCHPGRAEGVGPA